MLCHSYFYVSCSFCCTGQAAAPWGLAQPAAPAQSAGRTATTSGEAHPYRTGGLKPVYNCNMLQKHHSNVPYISQTEHTYGAAQHVVQMSVPITSQSEAELATVFTSDTHHTASWKCIYMLDPAGIPGGQVCGAREWVHQAQLRHKVYGGVLQCGQDLSYMTNAVSRALS